VEADLNTIINRFATPLTTGFFAVSTISGIALFFHWAPGAFHAMHEWLSIVLLAPFAFHVWKNWNALLGYARRKALLVPLAISLLAAVPFAVTGMTGSGGGNPAFRAIPLLTQAHLSDMAPILKTTPEALLTVLKERGYKVVSAEDTLETVASASGVRASDLLLTVLPAR
jgi:hypothetical protein